jgi:hypothetical protein
LVLESSDSIVLGSITLPWFVCSALVNVLTPVRPVPGRALEAWQLAHSTGVPARAEASRPFGMPLVTRALV